jgi:hypothetical protein
VKKVGARHAAICFGFRPLRQQYPGSSAAFSATVANTTANLCCHVTGSPDCLSASDVSAIKQQIFTDFPNTIAFDEFADRMKFELLTNVAN